MQRLATEEEAEHFLSNLKTGRKRGVDHPGTTDRPFLFNRNNRKTKCLKTYQITQIHMDHVYDCNRVTCPCPVTEEQKLGFEDMTYKIAETIGLYGIMDLEVIDDGGVLKSLEIDARIPSQTPTAVFHSTGVNLLAELVNLFEGEWRDRRFRAYAPAKERFVSFEHHYIADGSLQSPGEHIMGSGGLYAFTKIILDAMKL